MNSTAACAFLRKATTTATGKRFQLLNSTARRSLSSESLTKTAFYDLHVELGGTMVPFAGYELPVFYKGENGGVMREHLWCRSAEKASLFDVSHMGQIRWHGTDRAKFLETVVVGDILGLAPNEGRLSFITNEDGGIIDDTVITNAGEYVYMVVNGATKFGDMEHFNARLEQFNGDVSMEYLGEDMQLLALQGKGAAEAAKKILPDGFDLTRMAFMTGVDATLAGVEGCRITRCGYTGEDGFELAMPASDALTISAALLSDPTVLPTGLGARDSLRLEAGLCLYGNDIDAGTSPTEASLAWTMGGKGSRRRKEQGFVGSEKILTPEGKFQKTVRKRVGIVGMKAPAREGTEIFDARGETKIGEITSGTFSPCLKVPIAMGYVEKSFGKNGTDITVKTRNKLQKASVAKMPFVESHYYRVPE